MTAYRALVIALVLVGAAAGYAPQAQAVLLNTSFGGDPFKDTALAGTTSAARPELAGLVLEDVLQPFSIPAAGITGWVQNRVVKETVSGTLDFYWRVTVDPTSNGSVSAFRLGDFGVANLTDADWRIDGLGSAAPFVGRLFNPTGRPDGAINFLFTDPAVAPADPFARDGGSRFFFLHTDATAYDKSASYDLLGGPNDSLSGPYKTFRPAVPEPASWLLALSGLLGLAALGRRRGRSA